MYKFSPSKSFSYFTVLVWPLSTLYISLRYFRKPEAKNVFWLFCIFLGLIHIFNPVGGTGADGIRYAMRLAELRMQPISWEAFVANFYQEGGSVDIYQPLVTYIVAQFTGNPHWLFMVFSIVFGFFYSRNLWFVMERLPERLTFPIVVLTLYFALICPIWQINGVRMWTALHIFVYGALPYVYGGNRSKLGWCVVALFVHFSYFIPLMILIAYRFVPKSITFLFILYLITLFINQIDLQQVRSFLSFLPDFLMPRVESYTNEQYASKIAERKSFYSFHVVFSAQIVRWSIPILLAVICTYGKKLVKGDDRLKKLLCFSLFFLSIANVLALIPSGGRFSTIALMFALPAILFFLIENQSETRVSVIYMFTIIGLLLFIPIVLSFRVGSDFYGISLLLNPIASFFVNDTVPFIQYVKYLIG